MTLSFYAALLDPEAIGCVSDAICNKLYQSGSHSLILPNQPFSLKFIQHFKGALSWENNVIINRCNHKQNDICSINCIFAVTIIKINSR